MATTVVAGATIAGTTMPGMMAAAPFPFRPRNLTLSSASSFSPCSAVSPRRVPRLAMTSARMAMDKGLSATPERRHGGGAVAASAAGSPQFGAGENENPYEILGISPLDEFDRVKVAYKRRRKDVESCCDREYLVKLDRAYDVVMMDQLLKRKKGEAYESIQIMCISTLGHADWKPLQFLCFAYFYRILEKLKATEPAIAPIYNEYGAVEGQGIHMAKRVLRSVGLVLGSILAASLGYTGLVIFSQFLGQYIPSVVYNFQELIVTTASAVLLCILASYYR